MEFVQGLDSSSLLLVHSVNILFILLMTINPDAQ